MAVDNRARAWRFLVYPDTACEGWIDILTNIIHIQGYISPLHDPDNINSMAVQIYQEIDPDIINTTATLGRKQHFHGIAIFDGKKSYDQIKDMLCPLGIVVPPIQLARVDGSLRSAVRYLIHADDINKQQFRLGRKAIMCLGGATLNRYFELEDELLDEALKHMRELVKRYHFREITQLIDFCDDYFPDYAHLLNTRCMYVMSKYIDSIRHQSTDYIQQQIIQVDDDMQLH